MWNVFRIEKVLPFEELDIGFPEVMEALCSPVPVPVPVPVDSSNKFVGFRGFSAGFVVMGNNGEVSIAFESTLISIFIPYRTK